LVSRAQARKRLSRLLEGTSSWDRKGGGDEVKKRKGLEARGARQEDFDRGHFDVLKTDDSLTDPSFVVSPILLQFPSF
jgi:hypothetical protein